MTEFTLDTSGEVPQYDNAGGLMGALAWPDISPFAQGYVEAMFAELWRHPGSHWATVGSKEPGFSDLAPETLAAILKDCAAYQAWEVGQVEAVRAYSGEAMAAKVAAASRTGAQLWEHRNDGAWFWSLRVRNLSAGFPPLTPYLGDDGKVYLREAV